MITIEVAYSGRGVRREDSLGTGSLRRVPRVTRLMALAIRFDEYLRETGTTAAALAKYFGVTRAYLTQILNLTNLAPDIQEALLMLPRVELGRDPVLLRDLQGIAAELDWARQRGMWKEYSNQVQTERWSG